MGNKLVQGVIDKLRGKKTFKTNFAKNQKSKNKYLDYILEGNLKAKENFVPISTTSYNFNEFDPRLIAFYLPQFHSIPLNDEHYGKGFTEWTNVTKAIPHFEGHYQPHLPIDMGFYDLNNIDVMQRQIELAKMYGVHGFCFHYYWFSGVRQLEKPIFNYLNNENLDLPFCLCWANENWAKLWDGGNKDLLIEQKFEDGDAQRFMDDILPFMKDSRYIKIKNKPLLVIYRPSLFGKEKSMEMISSFREIAKENGFEDLYIVTAKTYWESDIKNDGFDAVVEFPPHNLDGVKRFDKKVFVNPNFKGTIYEMNDYIENEDYLYDVDYTLFKTVFPSWDNTARKAYSGGTVFADMTPELYEKWLRGCINFTKKNNSKEEQLVFINAWNEWAEGAHLEPDAKYGYAYLQATKDALEKERSK